MVEKIRWRPRKNQSGAPCRSPLTLAAIGRWTPAAMHEIAGDHCRFRMNVRRDAPRQHVLELPERSGCRRSSALLLVAFALYNRSRNCKYGCVIDGLKSGNDFKGSRG
jgi:hypothetical protein